MTLGSLEQAGEMAGWKNTAEFTVGSKVNGKIELILQEGLLL